MTVGDMTQKQPIRFKKVGNLMTVEKTYEGGAPRLNSLNKGANANLFLKNVSNFSQKDQQELDNLKAENKKLH